MLKSIRSHYVGGADIVAGKTSLEELEKLAGERWNTKVPSGREEYLQEIINSVLFNL